ncbi:hypothetical protein CBS101457_004042 [Exobasidium rhododendri]|nr:hypothetical protein CBS101457_004042 [Exobasidium rhododendri]
MTSRDSEARQSMGPPVASGKRVGGDLSIQNQRGPNPQTDYKRHFNRTKERFDVVNVEQGRKKTELDRACLKQAKLQEELEYLIDAIAGTQQEGAQLKEAMQRAPSPSQELYRHQQHQMDADDMMAQEEEEQTHQVEGELSSKEKRQRPSPADTDDELLSMAGLASKKPKKK